jgi:hypothetical protein
MNKDSLRACWIAELAIAYTGVMTDGKRLEMLGLYFDRAYGEGVVEGIERLSNAVQANL